MTEQPALLAKSLRKGRPPLTLFQHLVDTETVARRLFEPPSPWAESFPRFFAVDRAELVRHLRVAALFHDVGKANDGFQAVLNRDGSQTVRHEHVSALVLSHPAVTSWLTQAEGLDLDVVIAGVLSHHLKAARDGEHAFLAPRSGPRLELYMDHPQVRHLLARVSSEVLGIAAPPAISHAVIDVREDNLAEPWRTAKHALLDRARTFGRLVGVGRPLGESPRTRLALAVKAGVIAADSVASAMVREGIDIAKWIDDVVVEPRRLDGEAIRNAVIAPRVQQVEAQLQATFKPHTFQTSAAALGQRALLLAPCGAGKTFAAWLWAEAQARARPTGRVIFLYPTRGTATEGFRDYVGWAPEAEAALVHGSAKYELEEMSTNPPESLRGKTSTEDEAPDRLFALGLWSKRFFSATVDQFLSFLEHRYESLCLVPPLADSVVIFDEVHSYDGRMFARLLDFLRNFDVPALCMTATMPKERRSQLADVGLRTYPEAHELAALPDLVENAQRPRYRIVRVAGEEEALSVAKEAVRENKRVLWVVNTVRRCQSLARRLRESVDVVAYHSRFRLCDRRDRHAEVVARFKGQAEKPLVAVTTQVCEMSLDLDADVLITEYAPISSLIQRMGRANRSASRPRDFRAPVIVYPPPASPGSPAHRPYSKEDLEAAVRFLDALPGEVGQDELTELLQRYAPVEREALKDASGFITGGFFAVPAELRDIDEFGAPCILDSDVNAVIEALREQKAIDGFVVTVPGRRGQAWEDDTTGRLPGWLGVAKASQYNEQLGFLGAQGELE